MSLVGRIFRLLEEIGYPTSSSLMESSSINWNSLRLRVDRRLKKDIEELVRSITDLDEQELMYEFGSVLADHIDRLNRGKLSNDELERIASEWQVMMNESPIFSKFVQDAMDELVRQLIKYGFLDALQSREISWLVGGRTDDIIMKYTGGLRGNREILAKLGQLPDKLPVYANNLVRDPKMYEDVYRSVGDSVHLIGLMKKESDTYEYYQTLGYEPVRRILAEILSKEAGLTKREIRKVLYSDTNTPFDEHQKLKNLVIQLAKKYWKDVIGNSVRYNFFKGGKLHFETPEHAYYLGTLVMWIDSPLYGRELKSVLKDVGVTSDEVMRAYRESSRVISWSDFYKGEVDRMINKLKGAGL